jgi:hypothetical protein
MDLPTATKSVDDFLKSLEDTGDSGFEGLIAVVLQSATGQEFRLSSAGRQSGRDTASESGYGICIKAESKHYRETTSLKPRELLGEMDQAMMSDENLDMWILAASRSVDDQTAHDLEVHGERHGIEIVILDVGVDGLSRLGVLMAQCPEAVIEWAELHHLKCETVSLRSALRAIADAPGCEPAKLRLSAKLGSTMGYDTARKRANEQLVTVLGDHQRAKSIFLQSLGIRAPQARVVRRTHLMKQLSDWWDAPGFPVPAVALGEEGTGKTWAVFDWVAGRIERGDMPLVLPFAVVAQELTGFRFPETLLPRALAKWPGILGEGGWARRIHRWLAGEATGRPIMLLILDGLNERTDVEWRQLFATLASGPWRGKIAVLSTDRPHHWRHHCVLGVAPAALEIEVGAYSDEELGQALAGSGISYSEIPSDLVPLISIPRYCRLVVEHFKEMVQAADFTRERLIYLELKDRVAAKLGYPLNHEGLFGIVRELAERARTNPNLKPQELRSLVAGSGGDVENIYEEIVSGGLLVEVSPNAMVPAYRVEPIRMVFGFGMLLADELAKFASGNASDIEGFLTGWFEPQPHMDRKVEICGSAVFHALSQDNFPPLALKGLVRYWLGLRNWADTTQLTFTNYVLRRPEVFVDVAEDFWSSKRDSGAAQQFLGRAFVANRNNENVQAVLAPAIERWMGFVHPLGRDYAEFNRPRSDRILTTPDGQKIVVPGVDREKEERVRREIEARAGCPVVPGEIRVAGVRLTVISDGPLLRLARFGLMITSAGDPLPFIESLVHWAVASAVMDSSEFADLAAWVIRLSGPEVEAKLLGEARRLLERQEKVADAAARTLLIAIGNKESESLIQKHDLTPQWYKDRLMEHSKDPCRSFYRWTRDEAITCLGREDVPVQIILGKALTCSVDPSVAVPETLIDRTKRALRSIDQKGVHAVGAQTTEDHYLKILMPALCGHAPSDMADYLRGVVKTMPERTREGIYYLALVLRQMSLLLNTAEVSAVSRVTAKLSADSPRWRLIDDRSRDLSDTQVAEAFAFAAVAPHLSAPELFRRILTRPENAIDPAGLDSWFRPLPPDDIASAARTLHTTSDPGTLRRLLWMLPHMGVSLSDGDRTRLVQIATSDDKLARSGAIRAAVVMADPPLCQAIVDLGLSVKEDADTFEERWLSLLYARYARDLPLETIAERLPLPVLGRVIKERGYEPSGIDAYAAMLDRACRQVTSAADYSVDQLPEIELNAEPSCDEEFPNLREPAHGRTATFGLPRSWTSGPPTDSIAELNELFKPKGDEWIRKVNEDRYRRQDAVFSAWRTTAFQWYGRKFDFEALHQVYERHPSVVERWVQPALEDSPFGRSVRLRLATFLAPICRVLLSHDSHLGLELWSRLHKPEGNSVLTDTENLPFTAEDSGQSRLARQVVLEESWNDASLARVALACGRSRRLDWLREVTENLISAPQLWRRAKGLTLASLSDIDAARFEELVARAQIAGSWVEETLSALRENVRKNAISRHWYSMFLNAESRDTAWAALQIVLLVADERLLCWRAEIEKAGECGSRVQERLRFLDLGWDEKRKLGTEINRKGERTKELFAKKIQPDEIFPFMQTYL